MLSTGGTGKRPRGVKMCAIYVDGKRLGFRVGVSRAGWSCD